MLLGGEILVKEKILRMGIYCEEEIFTTEICKENMQQGNKLLVNNLVLTRKYSGGEVL